MASLVLNGNTSGSVTISSPAVSGSNTLTLPANTGTVITTASTFAGTGPTFSAYMTNGSANQSTSSGVFTKIKIDTEDFDTNANFDAVTNFRFTPTIAGYYQINGTGLLAGTGLTTAILSIYKNNSEYRRGNQFNVAATSSLSSNVSAVIYFNGTTDQVELWAYIIATSPNVVYGSNQTYFSGCLVRSA